MVWPFHLSAQSRRQVLERLLPELNTLPISHHQHGFCSNHSTTTVLLPLAHKIASGFNQSKQPLPRRVTMSIDLQKAFAMVNHPRLISSLTHSVLFNNTVRCLSAYLKGWMACCRYNFTTSIFKYLNSDQSC